MSIRLVVRMALFALVATALAPVPSSAQILETETARFLPRGGIEFNSGFEFQTSTEGTERAVPVAVELGLGDRLGLLVEPVVYTAIRPHEGTHATGVGDVELTALGLLRREGPRAPAISLGAEVKLPTTQNVLIGTGETDVTGYLIMSKRISRFDTHANVGYTVLGQPDGAKLNNIWSGSIAGEFWLQPRLELYGELLANTSSTPEAVDTPGATGSVPPEAVGGEVSGTMGLGVRAMPGLLLSLGLTFDNQQALQLRPGVTFRMR